MAEFSSFVSYWGGWWGCQVSSNKETHKAYKFIKNPRTSYFWLETAFWARRYYRGMVHDRFGEKIVRAQVSCNDYFHYNFHVDSVFRIVLRYLIEKTSPVKQFLGKCGRTYSLKGKFSNILYLFVWNKRKKGNLIIQWSYGKIIFNVCMYVFTLIYIKFSILDI